MTSDCDLSGREPSDVHAVDALLDASHQHPGTLTLVTLGPLTNVARALQRDPTLPERIARCVVMGAVADHVGNTNPVAEFNMWVDPHAVDVVLRSGLAIEFVGWDISRHYAVLDPTDAAAIRAIGTPLAEFCIDIQGVVNEFALHETKLAGFDLPDPIAMAYAIDPMVATETRRLHCEIETTSAITRGMVVMDLLGLTGTRTERPGRDRCRPRTLPRDAARRRQLTGCGELSRRARTSPCSGLPGHARHARTPRRWPWSWDPGTAGRGRRRS